MCSAAAFYVLCMREGKMENVVKCSGNMLGKGKQGTPLVRSTAIVEEIAQINSVEVIISWRVKVIPEKNKTIHSLHSLNICGLFLGEPQCIFLDIRPQQQQDI
jgi:hypothetical protein